MHGSPDFPFATYEQKRRTGEPVLDNHWHDEAEFLWMTEGQAVFQIGLSEYELSRGEAIFVPGGAIHGGHSMQGASCAYRAIVFQPEWLGDSGDGIGAGFMNPLQRGEAAIPTVYDGSETWGMATLDRLEKLYAIRESGDPAMALRIKAELCLLFADLIGSGRWAPQASAAMAHHSSSEQMKAVVAYIESHFAQPLTVTELSRVAGMSEGHFGRVFKSFMRKTPMEYVNHYRMRQAAEMLSGGNLSVGQVSLEVGLPNFSYFCKAFRTKYGRSPSEFRKKFRSL